MNFGLNVKKNFYLQILGDKTAKKLTFFDEAYLVWPWAEVPFTNGSLYYAAGSLPAGWHFLSSEGFYTVAVSGSNNGAGYGFIPAFNSKCVQYKCVFFFESI